MTAGSQRFVVEPLRRVGGELTVPGDKSISHRAAMLASVACGDSRVRGFLRGEDCLATVEACRALGVSITDDGKGELLIEGCGIDGLRAPSHPLDLGNSGTGLRLMAGLLAARPFDVELTGDESLRSRPMARIAEPLAAMGAEIDTTDGRAPLRLRGRSGLRGIDYTLPVASAQLKSALLLAGLSARGTTTVRSPGLSRDHTERMLCGMGIALDEDADAAVVSLEGPAEPRAFEISVPGDFSSAAFFIVAGCLAAPDGMTIRNVGVNPTRTGLMTILRMMGARIEMANLRTVGTEPVADLHVSQSELRGIEVPEALVPLAIDEFPVLFVAAVGATGRTVIRGAEELRHKECDRLAVMAEALNALGARARELPDGLIVDGGELTGGSASSHGDHRVAMALAVAAVLAEDTIVIDETAQVTTSFPGFVDVAAQAGLPIADQA